VYGGDNGVTPPQFFYLSAFVLGAIVGSFLNVCIYRLPAGKSIVTPPSSCPACGSRVRFYDNLPIVSYFLLAGRCRFCKASISWRYPVVEALNGVLWALVVYRFGWTASAWVFSVLVSSLVVMTFIDLDHQIIPDSITIPGTVLALLLGSLVATDPFHVSTPLGFRESLIGAGSGYGLFSLIFWGAYFYYGRPGLSWRLLGEVLFYLLLGPFIWVYDYVRDLSSKKNRVAAESMEREEQEEEAPGQGLGMGDVKLMTMLGGLIGWKGVLVTTFAGSLLGALGGITFVIFRGGGSKSRIPFGPFLSLGALLAILLGEQILGWYLGDAR